MEHQLDATITVLLISKISSTCFGQTFAHLQELKTEISCKPVFPLRNQALRVVVRCAVLLKELDGNLKSQFSYV
jgi:hypothetical protein